MPDNSLCMINSLEFQHNSGSSPMWWLLTPWGAPYCIRVGQTLGSCYEDWNFCTWNGYRSHERHTCGCVCLSSLLLFPETSYKITPSGHEGLNLLFITKMSFPPCKLRFSAGKWPSRNTEPSTVWKYGTKRKGTRVPSGHAFQVKAKVHWEKYALLLFVLSTVSINRRLWWPSSLRISAIDIFQEKVDSFLFLNCF